MRRVSICVLCLAFAFCGGPSLKKLGGGLFVDDVPAGKSTPHLYWMKDGVRYLVDREIQSYHEGGGCIIYETSRPSVAHALYAVEPGKTPVAAAATDSFRPWHFDFAGARRFDMPRTDADGVTTLSMDFVRSYKICSLAFHQPPFRDDWAAHDSQDFSRVEMEHTDFDVNGVDSVGNTTLSDQVRERHSDIVAELIRAGADVNAANDAGITVLITAVAFDDRSVEIMRLLLDAGAMVDARDNRGRTALMYAARIDWKAPVMLLLERGANPTLRDNEGRTAAAMTGNSPAAAEMTAFLDRAAAAAKSK